MKYEIVKYAYGKTRRYTGFCLTPSIEPRTAVVHGVTMTQTNEGPSSPRANHFLRPQTAIAWLRSVGGHLLKPDWSYIPGTMPV